MVIISGFLELDIVTENGYMTGLLLLRQRYMSKPSFRPLPRWNQERLRNTVPDRSPGWRPSRYPGFFIIIPVKTGIQPRLSPGWRIWMPPYQVRGMPRIGYGVNPVSSTGQAYRGPAWHLICLI